MTSIVSIANQKGGVGKTTTAVNLSAFASLAGLSVLLVDNDPQGNASSVFRTDHGDEGSFFSTASTQETGRPGIILGPSGSDLLSLDLAVEHQQRSRFASILKSASRNCDLVVIDCPPSLNYLPAESLAASDLVVIPIQCEYYAMEGLSQILGTLSEMPEDDRPDKVRILLTMFEPASPLCRDVAAEIRTYFPHDCMTTVIPRDISLASAPSHGKTIVEYDALSPGGLAYLEASKEILNALR
jgi:chromosome partitioning protein